MLLIQKASLSDVIHISPNLRSADLAELEAASGLPALQSLIYGFGHGRSWVVREPYSDIPVALFGVTPLTKTVGIPWMVATDELPRHKKFFVKNASEHIDKMLRFYPDGLVNYIDARNKIHITYIKHFGFEVTGFVADYGHAKLPFYRFSKNLKGLPTTCAPQPPS